MTRRELIGTIIRGSVVALLAEVSNGFEGGNAMAQETQKQSASAAALLPAYRGDNKVQPLPFEPGKLKGLSEKLILSHYQNNYTGAVNRLNQIQRQLGD